MARITDRDEIRRIEEWAQKTGTPIGPSAKEEFERLGLTGDQPAAADPGPKRRRVVRADPKTLVPPLCVWECTGQRTLLKIVVPYQTISAVNTRQWQAISRRTGLAWRAVRLAVGAQLSNLEPFALHYAAGNALGVTFVRLGGRHVDNSNLGSTTKPVEDAIAYLLGADDGDPRWHSTFHQEPGEKLGVRIEIERIT